MVGDDLEADIAGAQLCGMKTVARAHRQVPAGRGRGSGVTPDAIAQLARRSCPTGSRSTSSLSIAVRIGIDLIEIERVRRALERYPGFRERCFTEAERAYCDSRANPAQSYAGRFAGKEAVGKALGFGVRFTWKEIEIVGRPKPGVRLHGRTREVGRARAARARSTSR